nr:hypothetical protein [Tanacetum cinerariifolium]
MKSPIFNNGSMNRFMRHGIDTKISFMLALIMVLLNCTIMAELLRAPTEGYVEAILVPSILAEQFELKHSLINMMTSDKFFKLEKDNPHDHIRAARRWLEKELMRSILTWDDLVSKFINEFFPPQEQQISVMKYPIFINAKLSHAVNQQTSAVTTAMTAILKQFQATPPPASVKAVKEICVTCGGVHPYYQCLAAGGNTFLELRDNIQGYVAAAAVNYNQGNSVYRPSAPTQQNQVVPLNELEKVKRMNKANMKAMQTQINNVKNELRNEMKNSIQASMSNQTNELKNTIASFFKMNTASTLGSGSLPSNSVANPKGELKSITTRSGIILDAPSIPIPPLFINPKEDERVEETLTDQDLTEYTIKVPPPLKMLKALLSNKEKLQELANTPLKENCSAVILKKLPEKLKDPGKFLIPCGFNELKCKALTDLAGITKDVFVLVGKFTFSADFVIVDYESDSRVPLSWEDLSYRPLPSVNPTFSSHAELTSPEVKNDIFDPEGGNVLPEKLLDLDSTKDLYPPLHVNPLSGSTTSSSSPNQLLEEFADELALITFRLEYDDDLQFDIESDLKEIEYLLHHDLIKDIDSILKDSIDQSNLANLNDNLIDSMPEMFIDEHALDYSSPPLYDEYDDDLFEVESHTKNVYDDPFDSKRENIKESKLLINELDLPCDFLLFSKNDSFLSEVFSRVDALPSTNNEDKEEAGIQLNAEQADWKDDTDDESDDQELEAHYMYMVKIQEVSLNAVDSGPIFDTEPEQKVQNDDHYDVFAIECQHPEQSASVHKTYLIKQDAHNVIIESADINYDNEQIDQNDEDADLTKEHFKNKNNSLELSNNQFKEANNKLSEENDLMYANFKKSQAELKRRDSIEYASGMELECAKVRGLWQPRLNNKSCWMRLLFPVHKADVLEIYMQEFYATAKVHQRSIRFKMDTRKHIVNLEAFREMLHISPRIKTLTDVNVNKLYQPWRSFAAVINKCLTGKSSGIDSLRDDNKGEKTDESGDDDDQDEAEKVNNDNDDEEDISKIDEQEATESSEGDDEETESDRESIKEETREKEEESFDPIPRTPEDSEDDG